MAHSQTTTHYTERLALRNNNIYRIVNAHYKNTNMEVLKQIGGSKETKLRNMSMNYVCGWLFNDPNDKYTWTDKDHKLHDRYEIEDWWVCRSTCNLCGTKTQTLDEIEALILKSKHKEFVYTFRAYRKVYGENNYMVWEIFDLLNAWLENPKVELLMKCGQFHLCLHTKQLAKMNKKRQTEIFKYLLEHQDRHYRNWTDLTMRMRGIDDYYLFCECNRKIELYNYLIKQNESCSFYKDYLRMASENGHNIDDPYWKYPSHLRERHNYMVEQQEAIIRAKEVKIANKIKRVANKLSKLLNTKINGYEISVASNLEDIQQQAKVLSQCLMTRSYYKNYANKKCILVFIKKGEERIATAEVFYDKSNPLGQFYADEKDRNNCEPNNEIKQVFDTWLTQTYLPSNLCMAQ